MRLHSSTLTDRDMREALSAHGMRGVWFYKNDTYGSMTRTRAWEIRLESNNSNRLLNFGDGISTAATWDEWGIFFGELFRRDPAMIAGSASSKGWGYRGRADFRRATVRRFDHLEHKDQHKTHRFTWVKREGLSRCACGAGMRHDRQPVVVDKRGVYDLTRITDVERFVA